MRVFAVSLFASSCATLSLYASFAQGQPASSAFSNPYGGVRSYIGLPVFAEHKLRGSKHASRKSPRKSARKPSPPRVTYRRAVVEDAKPAGKTAAKAETLPMLATLPVQPVFANHRVTIRGLQDGPDIDLKWSADNQPTYPSVSGNVFEGGVNFKF